MSRRLLAATVACLVFWAAAPAPALAQSGGLTGAARISRVYDAILDARFDEVPGLLQDTCALPNAPSTTRPHPAVCQLLGVVSLWWQIQMDPADTSSDLQFARAADEVITAMEEWARKEPGRAEAWFYLGGAYGARGQWRVLRGQVLAAARDGKRIKDALERSLALAPSLKDAYFGIGLYHYYADVAPTAAKILRFLLFLPGGDREQGMREMLEARDSGQILRSEADYQLHVLFLWYERQPLRARGLVEGLRARHPRNPHFAQVIAEINDTYLHDDTASLRAWQAMLADAQGGRLALAPMAEVRARIGAARHLERLHEPDRAIDMVRPVTSAAPTSPIGGLSAALLLQAQALDRLGARDSALDTYQRAITAAGRADPANVIPRARAGIRTTPDATTTRAYRLSLDGWRALERGTVTDAARLIDQSLALRPDDLLTRYRRARVSLAQGDRAAALTDFERVASAPPSTIHPVFIGYASLEAAALHEAAGARDRARTRYARAVALFGADERTIDDARRALARLDASGTPAAR